MDRPASRESRICGARLSAWRAFSVLTATVGPVAASSALGAALFRALTIVVRPKSNPGPNGEDGIVTRDAVAHLLGVLVPQPGRAFDVGEEENQHVNPLF